MSVFLKVMKKLSSAFKEKPTVVQDDFELEHFLLYHGLVGSSPDGQRKFKDVQADIKLSVESRNPGQLAIALKVLPLWWEEKLETIFNDLDREQAIEVLTPERNGDTDTNNDIPLFHESWKVRANAAKMLAHLKATDKATELEASLNSTRENTKLALCHILYSLGELGEKRSLEEIGNYLMDSDPWLKVDAMGAYAQLSLDCEDNKLQDAIFQPHLYSDYSAVQVSKYIPLKNFLNSSNERTRLAGLRLVSGICQAAGETFGADIAYDQEIDGLYQELLSEPFNSESTPIYFKTLKDLQFWLEANGRHPHAKKIETYLAENAAKADLKTYIKEEKWETLPALALCQLEASIFLAGEHGTVADSIAALLIARLENSPNQSIFTDEILKSLFAMDTEAEEVQLESHSQSLTNLADSIVSMETRTQEAPSAQPVVEEDPAGSKTYFLILKALGNYPTDNSQKFLLKANADYAPDKRNQALKSLIKIASIEKKFAESAKEKIQNGLTDNSLEVRMTALEGAVTLEAMEGLEKVLDLTGAREVSLANKALSTLSDLAEAGHEKEVKTAVQARLKSVKNQYHREKLSNMLENIEKHGS